MPSQFNLSLKQGNVVLPNHGSECKNYLDLSPKAPLFIICKKGILNRRVNIIIFVEYGNKAGRSQMTSFTWLRVAGNRENETILILSVCFLSQKKLGKL